MKGADRESFMKTCLSADAAPPAHANSQQMKMKSCNSEAAAKKLSGDARKQFMSTCLKGSWSACRITRSVLTQVR